MTNHVFLDKFLAFWSTSQQVRNTFDLADIYHQEVVFIDPAGQKKGLILLDQYFKSISNNIKNDSILILNHSIENDQAYVEWQMNYIHPRLNRGQMISLNGISKLKWQDERIILHQDFFDLGAMLYEHVPIVGYLVRYIKNRLAS